jgi:hypothetical protein
MRPTRFAIPAAALVLCVPSIAWAEAAPPEGSKALTEILRPIETKPEFAYFEEVELEDGPQSLQNPLNLSGASFVYRTVEAIER